MKKNLPFALVTLFFLAFGLSKAQAQRIDELAPSGEFLETLYLTYSFYFDEAFDVYLDDEGAVAVRSDCENSADFQPFVDAKVKDFKSYLAQSKEDFGAQVTMWREALPTEFYAALVKAENMRAAAQNNLCYNSDPFCTDNGLYEFPAGVNAGTGEPGPYYSCLGTQPNPAWYYMKILEPGDMDIYMYSTPQVDIDFCCWGPFADPFSPCPAGLTRQKVVSCSYSTHWDETCTIMDAETDDYFILLITNYSNRECNIHFSKVDGTATSDCSILPPLVSFDNPVCEGDDLHLYANGTTGASYHWFVTNSSWNSNEQNPVRPNATRDMSGTYGCVISHDGQQSDTTYIEIYVGENMHYYIDTVTCNSYTWDGVEYTESGQFTLSWPTLSGCDSIVDLDITINYAPDFAVEGNHWPIGGSETYISVNEYAVVLNNPLAHVDTVLWQVDCENWRLEPHGKGETCTLYIYSFLEDPVMLHCTASNVCGTMQKDFFIRTSYFGVDETIDNQKFTVSPNPTNGNLTLRFGDLTGKAEITVYNSQGQKLDVLDLDVTNCKERTYIMSYFPDGLYYFVLNVNGKQLIRKVSLMR